MTAFPELENGASCTDMTEVATWVKENKSRIENTLAEAGVVLFRDFPINGPQDFHDFIVAFDYPSFTYEESLSNAVRRNITPLVFTANEAPPSVDIFLHHEMAQTPLYPSKLFFYCDIAPSISGGATPVCRSDILWQRLCDEVPEFAKDCADKGLKYTNTFPGADDATSGQGRSWRSLLNCETREAAEKRLAELKYTWEWLENDCLKITTPVLPAMMENEDGKPVFFNQLIAAFRGWKDERNDPSKAVTFGDGTALPRDGIQKAIEISDEITVDLNWQKGDIALVDNFLAMHGRRAFEGQRRVMASLVA